MREDLWQVAYASIQSLEDERGIVASSRSEVYGAVFGRDSLITGLKLLEVYEKTKDAYLLALVRKILESLSALQGRELVVESGEEPGKIIHEFRPSGHEHLTSATAKTMEGAAWYLYPDEVMRNYDTVDATPLYLMLMQQYADLTGDMLFVETHIDQITGAVEWLCTYGDINGDLFIDYRFHPDRIAGGLRVQSWMDSTESLFFEESDEVPPYPVAPVEAQAYAYVALRAGGSLLARHNASLAAFAQDRAEQLQEKFNETFVLGARGEHVALACGLAGDGRLLVSPRSSMGHVLWATYREQDGSLSRVLSPAYVEGVARRLLASDLFVPQAGVRTLSTQSKRYDPVSYHNGSIWPHDTAILVEGLRRAGLHTEARLVREALLTAYEHFMTPIELFGFAQDGFVEYTTPQGGKACRVQAWSAASLLSVLRDEL